MHSLFGLHNHNLRSSLHYNFLLIARLVNWGTFLTINVYISFMYYSLLAINLLLIPEYNQIKLIDLDSFTFKMYFFKIWFIAAGITCVGVFTLKTLIWYDQHGYYYILTIGSAAFIDLIWAKPAITQLHWNRQWWVVMNIHVITFSPTFLVQYLAWWILPPLSTVGGRHFLKIFP